MPDENQSPANTSQSESIQKPKEIVSFNSHKSIAKSFTDGQAFKAGLLAWVQRILILLSALMMSCSVFLYVVSDWKLSLELALILLVSIGIPLFIAVCVEAAVILSSSAIRRDKWNILAWVTLILATGASITGGELFFHRLAMDLDRNIQWGFALVGLFVPIFQVMFEINQENVKSFIKDCVDTTEVMDHILERQTDVNIVGCRFDARDRAMKSPTVLEAIDFQSGSYVISRVTGEKVVIQPLLDEKTTEELERRVLDKTTPELRKIVESYITQQPDLDATLREMLPGILSRQQYVTNELTVQDDNNQEIPINNHHASEIESQSTLAANQPIVVDKLQVSIDSLTKNPSITDEQLAEILELKRPASARFWRLKAQEIIRMRDDAAQSTTRATFTYSASPVVDKPPKRQPKEEKEEKSEESKIQQRNQESQSGKIISKLRNHGSEIWSDVKILENTTGTTIKVNGLTFKTFGTAYKGELAHKKITNTSIHWLFTHRAIPAKYFRYIRRGDAQQRVIVEHDEVKKIILDAIRNAEKSGHTIK